VTCVTASDCWAVGSYSTTLSAMPRPLTERWNGTSWTLVSSPNTNAFDSNYLTGISCASTSDCWAAGWSEGSSAPGGLFEHWNGTSWSIAIQNPGPGTRFYAVTCTSVSDCWAAGEYYQAGQYDTLIEHWNGSVWSVVSSPSPSTGSNELYGLTCSSPTNCWAVGTQYPSNGFGYQTLAEHFTVLAPTLTGTVSRKIHSAAGAFDIALPASGTPGIECRSGGPEGDHQVIFSFANNLLSVADVTTSLGNVSSSMIGPNLNQYTVNLTAIPNAHYAIITLSDVHDTDGNVGNISSTMGVLLADTTGNSTVNASDVGQVKGQVSQPVTNSNFRMDVNANGAINASDVAITKSAVGTAIPIPVEANGSSDGLKAAR